MSLFPAYGGDAGVARDSVPTLTLDAAAAAARQEQDACSASSSGGSSPVPSPRREHRLLLSDSDSDGPAGTPAPAPAPSPEKDYYTDCKRDTGNLRVSTLYWPGRPDYVSQQRVVGAASVKRVQRGKERRRRYWKHPPELLDEMEQKHLLGVSYRTALRDSPRDELLWLRYIHHQLSLGETAGMETALDAVQQAPQSRVLRERSHGLMRLALSPQNYVDRLQYMLTTGPSSWERGELWTRMVGAVACAADASAVAAVAAAGVAASPGAYPSLLHAYGGYLRAAGLWEDLVLLVELVAAMCFPPRGFPPPRDPAIEADADRQLDAYELNTIASGLPLGEIWSRVERARAAVHWRPALPGQCTASDPQRAPLTAPLAGLLLPLTPQQTQHVIVTLLRVCEVPLMPMSEHLASTLDPGLSAHGWETDSASGVLGLLRAARRVSPAHPANVTPGGASRVLAATSPRILTDAAGYGAWVGALWDAAGQWAGERGRTALACWRLRWLHARLLLTTDQASRRRLRNEARAVASSAGILGASCMARVEGAAAGAARGLHAAQGALRAAIADQDAPAVHVLYAARVVMELCSMEGAGADPDAALRAACGAVLRRPVPPHGPVQAHGTTVRETALRECEERCSVLQTSVGPTAATATDVWSAMLPSDSEWFAMRVALAPYSRRQELLTELLDAKGGAEELWSLRRREAAACALVTAAGREHAAAATARRLAALYPHNAYINIVAAGAPLWSLREGVRGAGVYTDTGVLSLALPAMLRGEGGRLRRVTARCVAAGCGAGGGGALHCWRLQAEGSEAALHGALAACPYSRALHVAGAALCPPLALSMPDLMLERRLRTHALPTELTPL